MVFDTDIALDEIDKIQELENEIRELKKYIKWQDDTIDGLIKENERLLRETEYLNREIAERDFHEELDYERELYDREEGWVD